MSIIFKYISKTLLTFFLGAVFVLSAIFFMQHFIRVFGLAVTYGADLPWVFSMLFKLLPDVLCLTAPMGFQLAILLTLTSMGESGEIMALRASGFSFKEITKPMLIMAVILSGILFYSNNWFTPQNTKEFLDARAEVRTRIGKIKIEPKTFINIGEWSLYADAVDGENMKQVHLVKKADEHALSTKVNAREGKVHLTNKAIFVTLFNGQMQRVSPAEEGEIIAASFDEYQVAFSLFTKKASRSFKPAEMGTPELYAYAQKQEAKAKAEAQTEISMRQVLSFSPIVLLLLSCPIGLNLGRRSNKAWAMLFSLVILFSFYIIMTLGISLGKKFYAFSYFAPLLPVVLGLIVARILWTRKLKK